MSIVLGATDKWSMTALMKNSSVPMPICSSKRILLNILPFKIYLICALYWSGIIMSLLINMLFHLMWMLAFATAFLFRFFTFTSTFPLCLCSKNRFLKFHSFIKVRRRTLMASTLTNLRDTFIIIYGGIKMCLFMRVCS